MHMVCQMPHQLCDPKLIVFSKLNSLPIVDITMPVSDRTLVGDLTESSFLVLLCDLSCKRKVQISLHSHCGLWVCCC